MSYVTILWSTAVAFALLLGIVHLLVWTLDRRAWAYLAFCSIALSVAGIVPTELGMMYASTPEEFGKWVRWSHLPIFFAMVGTILFIRLYLGAGRSALAGIVIAIRCAILVRNFTTHPNFNFKHIVSIDRIPFLGEDVAVLGEAVTSDWQWLSTVCGLLFAAFVLDATVTLWRKHGPDDRRRAVLLGGSILGFVAIPLVFTQLMAWGFIRMPVMIALPFLVTLSAMATELSRDILRAPRLARELGESERYLELAASATGLGMWVWDTVRDRIWATVRARPLFGVAGDDPIDPDRWFARIHPDDVAATRQAVKKALEGGQEYEAEYRICDAIEGLRWIAARGRAEMDASGRPVLIRGVVSDITDQKQAQDESAELRCELAHAGRVTMLGRLASALAHELSQPMAAILRNAEAAEMMLHGAAPDLEELRALIIDIHKDDRRAGDVIERLRALLKRRQLDFQEISVDALVKDVSALVRAEAVVKRVNLECVVAENLPRISGDQVHLTQVLINLIINGMDAATESDRPKRAVTVVARKRTERSIEVAVTDSGGGIPPETLGRLFEPFFTTKSGGMGMGLVVSRTIVEAHGGRLWAENNPTGGATFRFTIPAAKDDQ